MMKNLVLVISAVCLFVLASSAKAETTLYNGYSDTQN